MSCENFFFFLISKYLNFYYRWPTQKQDSQWLSAVAYKEFNFGDGGKSAEYVYFSSLFQFQNIGIQQQKYIRCEVVGGGGSNVQNPSLYKHAAVDCT